MTEIVPFDFDDHQVRVYVGTDGEPWWVVADICAVLDIGNPSDAVRRLDDDEVGLVSIDAPNGRQVSVNAVSEAGLFALILGSRKPEAKVFKRWVTHEVLPQIRRTGSYIAPRADSTPSPSGIDVLRAMVEQLATAQHTADLALTTSAEARSEAQVANARLDAIDSLRDWYSAVGWANLTGFRQGDTRTLNIIGRIAGTIGRANGLQPGRVPDEKYGHVNSWPRWVWDQACATWLDQQEN